MTIINSITLFFFKLVLNPLTFTIIIVIFGLGSINVNFPVSLLLLSSPCPFKINSVF